MKKVVVAVTLVVAMAGAVSLAAEQVGGPGRSPGGGAAIAQAPEWVQALWRQDEGWAAPSEDWGARDTLRVPEFTLEDPTLDTVEGDEGAAVSSWVAKRQPPRSLGSLVELYRSLAHGARTHALSAAPERRSGRRPAACRFGPFGLVCWNSARKAAVIRSRSSQ